MTAAFAASLRELAAAAGGADDGTKTEEEELELYVAVTALIEEARGLFIAYAESGFEAASARRAELKALLDDAKDKAAAVADALGYECSKADFTDKEETSAEIVGALGGGPPPQAASAPAHGRHAHAPSSITLHPQARRRP